MEWDQNEYKIVNLIVCRYTFRMIYRGMSEKVLEGLLKLDIDYFDDLIESRGGANNQTSSEIKVFLFNLFRVYLKIHALFHPKNIKINSSLGIYILKNV
jgi:hypothetical protein